MGKKEQNQEQTKQLLNHFPDGYKPTDIQKRTLQRIQAALDSDKKFLIICAPTGSGKSMLCKTLANTTKEPCQQAIDMIRDYSVWETDQFGNYINADDYLLFPTWGAFVLTISKQLQAQYQTLFQDTRIMMGKSNYQCQVDLNYDVETAPCVLAPKLKHKCWEENKCPYYNARNDAIASKFTALNYKMFMALPGHVKPRDIIVCDEASELEDELVKQFSAEIQYSVLKFVGVNVRTLTTDMPGRVLAWCSECLDHVETQSRQLKERNLQKLSDSDKIKLKVLMQLQAKLGSIIDNWNQAEYIIEKDVKKVQLTPLRVNKLSQHIFQHARKIVLLSATIIDPSHFAHELGIEPGDFDYIEVESTFDPKKSPIFISQKVKLNYGNLKDVMPVVAQQVGQLLEQHKSEKGIIHTHSNNITELLKSLLRKNPHFSRLLFREDGSSNRDILDAHSKSKEPTVLVSPSMGFGVDLKDDLARFQIVCKLPYSPLGSKRIKRLFDEDKEWYLDAMLKVFIQQCGRTTRSITDHSQTYVLDGNATRVILDNRDRLPKHFLDRFQ